MNCGYCGAEVTNRRGYCLKCGTRQAMPDAAGEETAVTEKPVPEGESAAKAPAEIVPLPEEWNESAESTCEARGGESWPAFDEGEDDLGYCEDVPALMLPTGRKLWKMILFGILTLGIYPTVIWSRMVTELNIAASCRDGKRTMSYFGMLLLIPVTLGVFSFVWMHKFCARIGAELNRRNLGISFGPRDFWLWNVLGMLILAGPFVFTHRLTKAMNLINRDFNSHG